jgi:membrane fusion protein (multidrug efflux system)
MPAAGEIVDDTRPTDIPPKQGPASPRGKLLKFGVPALLVLIGVGVLFWLYNRNRESTDDAQVDGHIAPISPKISGSVLEVLVNDNMQVKAGQTLVRIDPRDYQARVEQLKAAVTAAESQVNAAQVTVPLTRATTASNTSGAAAEVSAAQAQYEQAQVAAQEAETSNVATAEANVRSAEANNQKAQADLVRMQTLVAKEEISKQQFDSYRAAAQVGAAELQSARERLIAAHQRAANARAAANAAEAKVQQARAGLAQSRAGQQQVKVTAAQEKSAAANTQQARANLEAADLQLSYTTITAPIDGVVTQKSVEPGQMLQPGQAIMTIVPLQDVWVTANFKETQLADVRPGDAAEVKVDMYGRKIPGRVDSIAGATGSKLSILPPENATGNFVKVVQRIPVKIVFDRLPPGVILRPGMNVDATIITK